MSEVRIVMTSQELKDHLQRAWKDGFDAQEVPPLKEGAIPPQQHPWVKAHNYAYNRTIQVLGKDLSKGGAK